MTKKNSDSSVDTGIPWWIWVLIVPVTIAVVAGTVLSQLPDDPAEVYAEIRALLEDGKYDEAELLVPKLEGHADYAHHVALVKGVLAYARQREPVAIRELTEAAKNESLRSEALELMGGSYSRTGDYLKAVQAYQDASAADPNNVNARLKLAQFHYAIGGMTHAVDLVESLIEDGNRAARTLRASALFDMEYFQEALEDYAELLKTPGDRAAASPDLINRYVIAALETQNEKHIEIAKNEFARMMANKMLGAALYSAAGDTDSAKRMIEEMTHLSEFQGVSKVQADVAYRLGDFKQAENFVLKAVPQYPRDRDTLRLAVRIFEETGNDQALQNARKNLELLDDLVEQFRAIVDQIDDDIGDAQLRLDAVEVLKELARPQDAMKWNQVAGIIDPTLDLPSATDVLAAAQPEGPLVPLVPDPPTNRPRRNNGGTAGESSTETSTDDAEQDVDSSSSESSDETAPDTERAAPEAADEAAAEEPAAQDGSTGTNTDPPAGDSAADPPSDDAAGDATS